MYTKESGNGTMRKGGGLGVEKTAENNSGKEGKGQKRVQALEGLH